MWESPRAKENLAPVGFELTTSELDLPVLYRLSYEASTGASLGNLDSEFQISFKRVATQGDLVYRQYCLVPAP